MSKNSKIGLEGLLRPEDSILVLIDHQPYQFTNLNSHEPTMIINNAWGLGMDSSCQLACLLSIWLLAVYLSFQPGLGWWVTSAELV